ncbi:hypothetical protein ACT4UM_20240, partial [Bacillus sp. SS-TM]
AFVVIDSIQTIHLPEVTSAPGSVAQVRECTAELMKLAKTKGIPIFIVGHVTKEGAIAGPRMLEHMVDAVLYFEGDRHHTYRILRAVKNRFGSTNEMGIFEMKELGLVPSIEATTVEPATPTGLSSRKISEGFKTSARPSSFISKIPISFVEWRQELIIIVSRLLW